MSVKTNNDMISILSDLDDNQSEIARAKKLLIIYDEQLGEEIKILDYAEKWIKEQFLNRLDLLRAVLDSAIIQICDAERTMQETLDQGLAICRREPNEKTA